MLRIYAKTHLYDRYCIWLDNGIGITHLCLTSTLPHPKTVPSVPWGRRKRKRFGATRPCPPESEHQQITVWCGMCSLSEDELYYHQGVMSTYFCFRLCQELLKWYEKLNWVSEACLYGLLLAPVRYAGGHKWVLKPLVSWSVWNCSFFFMLTILTGYWLMTGLKQANLIISDLSYWWHEQSLAF